MILLALVEPDFNVKPDEARTNAAENDLGWTQGFLGDSSSTAVPEHYGVRGLPPIWLIGLDGKVVVKDLRGERIYAGVTEALSARRGGHLRRLAREEQPGLSFQDGIARLRAGPQPVAGSSRAGGRSFLRAGAETVRRCVHEPPPGTSPPGQCYSFWRWQRASSLADILLRMTGPYLAAQMGVQAGRRSGPKANGTSRLTESPQ